MVTYTCKDSGTTNYTYDNNGSQLTTTIGASTTTNTYDLFGQLKSYTGMDSVLGVDIGNGGETEPGKYANSSIYAIYDGELMYSNYRSKNGNIIVLGHKLPNGVIFYSSYSHLASFNVPMVDKQDENPENDIYFEMKIDGGTLIGKMGDTGGDWDAHLHLAVYTSSTKKGYTRSPYGYDNKIETEVFNGQRKGLPEYQFFSPIEVIRTGGAILG